MPEVQLDTLPALLAMCEGVAGAERVRWILLPPLIFLVWALVAWACLWRDTDPNERSSLLLLLGVCAATGGLIFLLPEGTSGDGNYLWRFWISILISGGIGLAWGQMVRPIALWRSIGVALAGDVIVPGGLILLLFWALGLSGGCLG